MSDLSAATLDLPRMQDVTYTPDCHDVDWEQLKATLAADGFDNGRTAAQLRDSFRNSAVCAFAFSEGRVVGKARALSDMVCNAYIVDVWTWTPCRRQGIGTRLVEMLLDRLPGQHVYMFTEDCQPFYEQLGFRAQPEGFGRIVGDWLRREVRTR